jgi:DNA-binding HxlR family transcriptional regulator
MLLARMTNTSPGFVVAFPPRVGDIAGMKSYGQFCPIAKAAGILAERWTLLVVRELMFGSRHYNDIRRGVPKMSPTLLAQRLKQLEDAGVVERVRGAHDNYAEYQLTRAGSELRPVLMSLAAWGHHWAFTGFSRQDLDAGFLMWSIRRSVSAELLPKTRTVIQVQFSDRVPLRHWWLIIDNGEVDLCIKDPGHDVDLLLCTNLMTLTKYFDARLSLTEAKATGQFRLQGSSELIRSFGKLLRRPAEQRG